MSVIGHDTLKTRRTLTVDGKNYDYFSLDAAASAAGLGDISRLPFSLKVLLENLVRLENGRTVTVDDIKAARRLARHQEFGPRDRVPPGARADAGPDRACRRWSISPRCGRRWSISAATRKRSTRCRRSIWSSTIRCRSTISARPTAFAENVKIEFERNGERYRFLRWGQDAFENFRLVPPGTGICHQVNLEYLSQVVWTTEEDGKTIAYPDTLVGTDSHTTMVNGLSVLGWGVGGIEAEAAMLGQPMSMLIPEVVGMKPDRQAA